MAVFTVQAKSQNLLDVKIESFELQFGLIAWKYWKFRSARTEKAVGQGLS